MSMNESTPNGEISVAAYIAQLEGENAALKARLTSFETGLEAEIIQRVEARELDRRASFAREVESRAVALMATVGQPAPVSADLKGGNTHSTANEPEKLTGLARAKAFLESRRRSGQ
jgi:hypothetical protein